MQQNKGIIFVHEIKLSSSVGRVPVLNGARYFIFFVIDRFSSLSVKFSVEIDFFLLFFFFMDLFYK